MVLTLPTNTKPLPPLLEPPEVESVPPLDEVLAETLAPLLLEDELMAVLEAAELEVAPAFEAELLPPELDAVVDVDAPLPMEPEVADVELPVPDVPEVMLDWVTAVEVDAAAEFVEPVLPDEDRPVVPLESDVVATEDVELALGPAMQRSD